MNPDGNAAIIVLLSSDLTDAGNGLDPQEIKACLQASDSSLRVGIFSRLTDRLEETFRAAVDAGADRLVLGLEHGDYPAANLQLAARKAGLDSLGIEVINFGAYPVKNSASSSASGWAAAILLGAAARARAFEGSHPESLKPYIPKRMSRRSLFSLPAMEYRAVPTIDRGRCRARDGCQQCVNVCPHQALTASYGYVHLNKSHCTGCGLCVTACPQDAIDLPGSAPGQVTAQITEMLQSVEHDDRAHGILFHCQNSERTLQQLAREQGVTLAVNWLPIQVPCLAMVTSNWMLAPLSLGAAAVAVLPCHNGCRAGQSERVAEHAELAQQLLDLLDQTDKRVYAFPREGTALVTALREFPEVGPPKSLSTKAPEKPLSYGSRASLLLRLAEAYQADSTLALDHPQLSYGVIEVTDGCTLCGGCASACPTGALILDETSDASVLSFDASACVACEQCLPACPETNVIHLRRGVDFQSLQRGRTELQHDSYQRCVSCGKPIASTAMSQRVAAMLGDEFAGTVNIISHYCIDCRGMLS